MPNERHNKMPSKGGFPTGQRGPDQSAMNEKTPDWPGVPGKTQKDRSGGTKKCKCWAKSEGI